MNAATSEARKFSPSPRPTTSGELRRAPTTTSGASTCVGDQGERALEPAADPAHRLGEVDGAVVGGACASPPRAGARRPRCRCRWRAVAALLELGPQRGEVLDDAVVDDRDRARAVEVRVGVAVVGRAVGGPPGVADAGRRRPGAAPRRAPLSRLASLPARFSVRELAVGEQRDAGGVVAAVLQPPQPLDHDLEGRLLPDVAHDAAHG